MEISPFIVYLITRLDCANNVLAYMLALFTVAIIVLTITLVVSFLFDTESDAEERCSKIVQILKPISIVTFILLTIRVLLPTTKQACVIIVVPAIANSQTVQETLPKSINRIVELAGDYLVDLLSEQTDKVDPLSVETKTP